MFFVSVLLVVVSSWLITKRMVSSTYQHINLSTLTKDNIIYFLLTAFSQIVLSFEILSLFSAISKNNFLICNIIFLILSAIYYCYRAPSPLEGEGWGGGLFSELKLIKSALKRDKFLIFLSICFIIFCVLALIKIFLFPVTYGDAVAYYLTRCTMWIQQGNINHFITPDTRELIMPIDMEFLYTWVLIFTKSERGIAIFSFLGFLFIVNILYNFLGELKFSVRRRLWAIFVFSSFALVGQEIVIPCADLFIGALILGSIYLFYKSVKYNDKVMMFFSALSYALAVGTKTTAIIALPSVFLIFCFINYTYTKNFKQILFFCGFFIINFLIFSSYNYILNFIQFGNFISCKEQFLLNEFTGEFKGYLTNLIKYCFSFFDMSGMPFNINGLIEYWQALVLKLFNCDIYTGTSKYFPAYFKFDNNISITTSFLGFMGLIAFIPSVFYSIRQKKSFILMILAFSIIFNILLFSRVMLFTGYNMRYLLTFICIASPVLVYSYPYKHKFYKIFLCLIIFIYLIGATYKQTVSYLNLCFKYKIFNASIGYEETLIHNYFIKKPTCNIALIRNQSKSPIYYIEKLRLNSFKIDKLLLENIESYDFNKYDYIITNKKNVSSTNIVNFKDKIKYPDLFVTKCIYKDNKQNIIYNIDEGKKPAFVICDVPLEYFEQKGFIPDKNITGDNYIILKRK